MFNFALTNFWFSLMTSLNKGRAKLVPARVRGEDGVTFIEIVFYVGVFVVFMGMLFLFFGDRVLEFFNDNVCQPIFGEECYNKGDGAGSGGNV